MAVLHVKIAKLRFIGAPLLGQLGFLETDGVATNNIPLIRTPKHPKRIIRSTGATKEESYWKVWTRFNLKQKQGNEWLKQCK